jgi:pimeloyl-ACP methyl ester carboxylesterase
MPSTLRFVRQYMRPQPAAVRATELQYQRGGDSLPATLYRPAHGARRLPGWVVLHGLTRSGRAHRSLIRFAGAVAAAGNVVFVPEIPEWRDLRVAPELTMATIRAAVHALQQRDDIRHEHVGLFGFSFGATQGLIAAADTELAGMVAGIASWGGYCDLTRVFRFGLTGLHGIDGTTWQMRPDPYGAWVMAGNYLHRVPGLEDATEIAAALHELAIESGERGSYAWEPVYDASKLRLRARLSPAHREIFDIVAPLTTRSAAEEEATRERALALANELASTALALEPLLDPAPFLPLVRVPILFAHGRDDRLIPFTESIRLSRRVPAERMRDLTITSLFQHSGGTQSGLGPVGLMREGTRFINLLRRVLRLV